MSYLNRTKKITTLTESDAGSSSGSSHASSPVVSPRTGTPNSDVPRTTGPAGYAPQVDVGRSDINWEAMLDEVGEDLPRNGMELGTSIQPQIVIETMRTLRSAAASTTQAPRPTVEDVEDEDELLSRGGFGVEDSGQPLSDDEDGTNPDAIEFELGDRDENGLYLYERLAETFERELLDYGTS